MFDWNGFLLWLEARLPAIAVGIGILLVGWLVAKWSRRLARRVLKGQQVEESLAGFLSSLLYYLVLAATLVSFLQTVGIPTASLLAVLASAGLAVGLALQGSLSNFAAGVMILFFKPFRVGDRVTAAGHTATVTEVGLFATRMLTPDRERVIAPNSEMIGGSIINHTVEGVLRGNIQVGVAYGTDLQQAIQVALQSCRRVSLVLSDPEPAVAFTGFGASSLDLVVRPWAKSSQLPGMLHEVRLCLYEDLNSAGIEIPFDQIVVHRAEA